MTNQNDTNSQLGNEEPLPGGQVPFEDAEDDAMWDRVWRRTAAEEANAVAQRQAAASNDDSDQERAEVMADIISGLYGDNASDMV